MVEARHKQAEAKAEAKTEDETTAVEINHPTTRPPQPTHQQHSHGPEQLARAEPQEIGPPKRAEIAGVCANNQMMMCEVKGCPERAAELQREQEAKLQREQADQFKRERAARLKQQRNKKLIPRSRRTRQNWMALKLITKDQPRRKPPPK